MIDENIPIELVKGLLELLRGIADGHFPDCKRQKLIKEAEEYCYPTKCSSERGHFSAPGAGSCYCGALVHGYDGTISLRRKDERIFGTGFITGELTPEEKSYIEERSWGD